MLTCALYASRVWNSICLSAESSRDRRAKFRIEPRAVWGEFLFLFNAARLEYIYILLVFCRNNNTAHVSVFANGIRTSYTLPNEISHIAKTTTAHAFIKATTRTESPAVWHLIYIVLYADVACLACGYAVRFDKWHDDHYLSSSICCGYPN